MAPAVSKIRNAAAMVAAALSGSMPTRQSAAAADSRSWMTSSEESSVGAVYVTGCSNLRKVAVG